MSDELLALGDRLVAAGEPGEQVEVVLSQGTGTSVRAYQGEVEAFTSATSRALGVRVIVNGRQGFASAGSHDLDVAIETLAEARDNVAFAEVDPHVALAEPDGRPGVDVDPWSDAVSRMTDANRIALAIELEAKVLGGDARITGVRTASFGDGSSESVIVSSTGIRVAGRHSHTAMSVQAMAGSGDDTSTGYGYDGGRDVSAIDVDAIAAEAVDRAVTMLGAAKPDSAKVAAVFEPRKTASLLGIVGGMLSGDRKLRGRTPFADRLDEVIASPLLTLVDDPTDARSLSADSHDGEGLATRANTLIDRGRLARFLYDTVTARRAGTVSTSSAVRSARSTPGVGVQALIMHPGSGSLDDLVAGVDRGVFVYALQGLHSGVNAVSGDFSVGVEGRMIRKGQLAEPIREATIASTLPRLLLDISAVADDREWLTSGDGLCSMVIDGVSLGGT